MRMLLTSFFAGAAILFNIDQSQADVQGIVTKYLQSCIQNKKTCLISQYSAEQAFGIVALARNPQQSPPKDAAPWAAPAGVEAFNGVWVRAPEKVAPEFAEAIRTSFNAVVEKGDFDSGATEKALNDLIAQKTRGGIEKFFNEGALTGPDVNFIILNVIYLSQTWIEPFDPKQTVQGPFQGPKPVQASFMRRMGPGAVAKGNGATSIVLDLKDGLKIQAVLPSETSRLATLLDATPALDSHRFEKNVDLWFPRLTLSSRIEESLGDHALPGLGLDSRRLIMTQATGLKLDEKGVAGFAATGIQEERSIPRVTEIKFDRPFLLILHGAKGERLFTAVVNAPEDGS